MSLEDKIIHSRLDAVEAQPLVDELAYEYATRYADFDGFEKEEDAPEEIDLFPPFLFEAPYGDLLLIQRGTQTIAGGAFMYLDEETAEVKRVWTSKEHRRQGLSRRIMTALESAAAERGYRRIYLTTGPRQPEAKHLYLSLDYTPLFDLDEDPEKVLHLAFEKVITPLRDGVDIEGSEDEALKQRNAVEETYRWRPRPHTRLADLKTSA
ncbi:GNAT family N-acetyltransferase [Corynebacterium callunae]|uniref:GNAT family N-acetyltransferase n=1 Tax=Corynebacterium callunae TaxID=1721 RepID=UPI003982672F